MYSTDFEIEKENDKYYLVSEGKKIRSYAESKDFLCDKSELLMEYIRSDLDRNGNIEINEDGTLTFNVFCAYFIFSRQKELLDNSDKIFKTAPLYDHSLIQTANGPPLETEQLSRLVDIRNAAKERLGEEHFSQLSNYVWGVYYENFGGGFGENISPHEFEKTPVSKKIFKLIKELSPAKQGIVLVLTDCLEYKSILLAIGLVEKWISVQQFVESTMGLSDNILNLSGVEGEDETHQDMYNYFQNIAVQSLNYLANAEIPLPEELTLEESISHEYKASFRTPYPNHPDAEVDKDGQTIYKLGNQKFKSKKEVEKFLEEQCLKTIVAFLNTKGGTLVIGVHEKDNDKTIVGIDREGFKSQDAYERHISQQITNRIGKKFHGDFINIETKTNGDKLYCVIKCEEYIPAENQIPAHLDEERCYRRTTHMTVEIKSGVELSRFAVERQKIRK